MLQASNTIIIDPPGELSASRVLLDHERWEQTFVFRIGTGLKTDLALTFRNVEEDNSKLGQNITGIPTKNQFTLCCP